MEKKPLIKPLKLVRNFCRAVLEQKAVKSIVISKNNLKPLSCLDENLISGDA